MADESIQLTPFINFGWRLNSANNLSDWFHQFLHFLKISKALEMFRNFYINGIDQLVIVILLLPNRLLSSASLSLFVVICRRFYLVLVFLSLLNQSYLLVPLIFLFFTVLCGQIEITERVHEMLENPKKLLESHVFLKRKNDKLYK